MTRIITIATLSILLTLITLMNAYYQKRQFYTSVVYITKSNASLAVLYLQSFVFIALIGNLMKKFFFGELRRTEIERLTELSWYAIIETCLAFSVFRDDFNLNFLILLIILLGLKAFHWLGDERVEYIQRSPVISWLYHLRLTSLFTILGIIDVIFIYYALEYTLNMGATTQLVFGFECAILLTFSCNSLIKYSFHLNDIYESPWENKVNFLLHTELIVSLIRVILYIIFMIIMVRLQILPLFAFRPFYYTINAFKKALKDVILSRRAIRNMNKLYPNVSEEELASEDNVCIICREEMQRACKKLPCKHIFHTSCLRSWFQRQQSCPTCRLNVLITKRDERIEEPGSSVQRLTETEVNVVRDPPVEQENTTNQSNPSTNVLCLQKKTNDEQFRGINQKRIKFTVKSIYSMHTVLEISILLKERNSFRRAVVTSSTKEINHSANMQNTYHNVDVDVDVDANNETTQENSTLTNN